MEHLFLKELCLCFHQNVEEALRYNDVESVLEDGEQEDIFSPEYFDRLVDVKMPATKLELLIKMLTPFGIVELHEPCRTGIECEPVVDDGKESETEKHCADDVHRGEIAPSRYADADT